MPKIEVPETWQLFDAVTSTSDTLHEAAAAGAPEGTVHVARAQTRGRGRAGRAWWSPPGAGLWMSVLLRPRVPPERTPPLALLSGLAVKEALDPLLRRPVEIHWPNDLMVGGRKLGGILCELRNGGGGYWIAVGFGVNVDHSGLRVPETVAHRPIALRELGCADADPLSLGRRITSRFWPLYGRYQDGEPFPRLLGDALASVGARVRARTPDGRILEGTAVGLGPLGELRIADGGTDHVLAAADVEHLEERPC